MMRRTAALLATLLLSGAAAYAAATAEELPARVSLEKVVELLNERSPETIADRKTIDIVAADRLTARAFPNPYFSFDSLRLTSGESTGAETQQQYSLAQPLPIFGTRRAGKELADLNVSAETSRVASDLAQRRLEVRQAFISLVARQESLRVLQESLTELQRVEGVVRGRAEAGDRSQYEVLRIETERRVLEVEVQNAVTDVEDSSRELATLLGFPGWRPEAEGSLEAGDVPVDFDALWETAQLKRPSIVTLKRRQSAAEGELALARRERAPIPTLSGGILNTQDVTGTSLALGVSLPLPLFDRNKGAIARASAEVDADKLALDAEMAKTRAEIERSLATLVARRKTLETLEADIVKKVPDLRRMAEDAYREGRGDILELLDASRSLKDIQMLHIQQLEATKEAEEEVIAAAGLDEKGQT